ncbi:MAG: BatA domain-containing protein, partial [Marinomonas sp.]
MFGTALSFASPAILGALILLPAIWWLLRLTPPRPQRQDFPPTRLLAELTKKEDTPHKSPWWLTAIRLCLAALAIIALAGPFWQPNPVATSSDKPLLLVVDNGWTTAR